MDEKYIHKNYQCHEASLCDRNQGQGLEVMAMDKGRRKHFIAAIIDGDKFLVDISDQERPEIAKAYMLHET